MTGPRISEEELILAAGDGLAGAIARFQAASGLRATYVAMAEALSWITILDGRLWDQPWYESECSTHDGGQIQPGLRYARNFATHQLVALTERRPGVLVFPLYSGPGGTLYNGATFHWLPLEELPKPGKPTPHTPAQRRCYAERLAGQDVGRTLLLAAAWFERAHALGGEA